MRPMTPRLARLAGAVLLGLAGVFPAGIVGLYLFYGTTDWQHGLSVAMAPESSIRYQFPLLIAGAFLSLISAVTLAVSDHRVVVRLVLALATVFTIAYALVGAWSLVLVSALPLWWLYEASA